MFTSNQNTLIQRYLDILYQKLPKHNDNQNRQIIADTYGEVLAPEINKLITHFNFCQDDTFLDLGSGNGRITAYIFLSTKIKAAYGIELQPSLYQQAHMLAIQIKKDFSGLLAQRQIQFYQGNFLSTSFCNANSLFINSTCFHPSLLSKLTKLINENQQIHTILSLRPLPKLTLPFKKIFNLECSWDTARCHVYSNIK